MQLRNALAGALAPIFLSGPVWADIRTSIPGAEPILTVRFSARPQRLTTMIVGSEPILPSRFTSSTFKISISGHVAERSASLAPKAPSWTGVLIGTATVAWHVPLVDRVLSASEKEEPLAEDLIDAVIRIEPLFDPTRLDGPDSAPSMSVSAGTASMDSVFADRWQRTYLDPNINAKVGAIALAWRPTRQLSCDDFIKNRPHSMGEPVLTALNEEECRRLAIRTPKVDPVDGPIVLAALSVPVFAAPMPGSRVSSETFWAKRREKVLDLQAKLHQKWERGPSASFRIADRR